MYFTSDVQAIATQELHSHLEVECFGREASLPKTLAQLQVIAPELPALVNAIITSVIRIGFTRNAAATPYIVYKVGVRKCCTFVKKRLFLDIVVTMMSKYYKNPERLKSATLQDFPKGLVVHTSAYELGHEPDGYEPTRKYIPDGYVNKFLKQYNNVAVERIQPQEKCDCNDIYSMCLHQIAGFFAPKLEEIVKPVPQAKKYNYKANAVGRKQTAANMTAYWEYVAEKKAEKELAL